MRIRAAVTLAATVAVWVGVTAATAPTELVQGTAHAAVSVCETDAECAAWGQAHGVQPGYGVAQSFDMAYENTIDQSCWVEKVSDPATAEVVCGSRGLRPDTDTAEIGQVFGDTTAVGCGWVASWAWAQGFDIAPVGCN